ncbi:exopolyphosphatase [Parasalinivibrio latis]|uniref:exopolyphosphatase n=1 Tax=Parasalinivibrio latis TaxID=2952610 RepID=UPI0030E16FC4
MQQKGYRLVTRSDFDGLVCAVLLKHLDLVNDITFVHPKDMQDGKVEITENDITTNLPYVPDAYLSFDHHASELIRNKERAENHIIDGEAPSAARVVWKHFGGHKAFPAKWDEMMDAVDKGDSANFNRDEVLYPEGWNLLNFLMDARTGLGRFREFRISNYQLMMELIDYCKDMDISDILLLEDVQERVEIFREHRLKFHDQLNRCSTIYGNLIVLDLRDEEVIWAGNRFEIYAMYPQCNISIHILWGLKQQNTVFATGKSIFNRTSNTNVGELMLEFGGGGHHAAGTCQVDNDKAKETLHKLIARINTDG